MKGSSQGPQALLDASAHMELYDIETDSEVFRRGMITMEPVHCPDDPWQMVTAVYERARPLVADGKFVVGIGGEHSVSVGLVRAVAEKSRIFLFCSWMRIPIQGTRMRGAGIITPCVMSRIGELCPYVQAGIRSMDASEMIN